MCVCMYLQALDGVLQLQVLRDLLIHRISLLQHLPEKQTVTKFLWVSIFIKRRLFNTSTFNHYTLQKLTGKTIGQEGIGEVN